MRTLLERTVAVAMDSVMCAMMNRLQWRLRGQASSKEAFERYLDESASHTRESFYDVSDAPPIKSAPRTGTQLIEWHTAHATGYPGNDIARALWFIGPAGPSAPTVVVLHALMSASDVGYRRLAHWFQARGWNMIFPHLPFHYSRKVSGYANGALAVTANLPLVAETLRQSVKENRQILALLRSHGVRQTALLGTSYGGWVGSLLSFLEPDFRFITLIQPVIDVEHITWQSPAAASIRRIIRAKGIAPGDSNRHAHLSSPLHGRPLTPADRITLIAGAYDTVAPPAGLRELAATWPGARFVEVRQGHFGYAALAEARRLIEPIIARRS